MKYFIIFSLIIFLGVMYYLDILKYLLTPSIIRDAVSCHAREAGELLLQGLILPVSSGLS